MATTVKIPLQLSTVNLADANAFWATKDGTNYDYGYVGFVDAATGTATYWGIIPQNVNATPAWDVVLYHGANAGAGGNVILNVDAIALNDGETVDAALTALVASKSLATGAAGLVQLDNLASTNFDGTLTVAAGDLLIVEVNRLGGDGSDTVGDQWNLYAVVLEVDI